MGSQLRRTFFTIYIIVHGVRINVRKMSFRLTTLRFSGGKNVLDIKMRVTGVDFFQALRTNVRK